MEMMYEATKAKSSVLIFTGYFLLVDYRIKNKEYSIKQINPE